MTAYNILFTSPRGGWQRDKRLQKGLKELGCSVHETESFLSKLALSESTVRKFFTNEYSGTTSFAVAILWVIMDSVIQFAILILYTNQVRRADILYVENPARYAVFAAKVYGVIWRTPVVYDPHGGVYYAQVVGRGIVEENSHIANLWYHLDRFAAKVSDIYILGSQAQKIEFEKFFSINGENVCVIYTGADEDRFDVDHSDAEKDVNFLYWGTFIRFHRTDLIIEAAKALNNDISIIFAGKGSDPKTEQRRQELIEKVNSEDIENVEFLGWISQKELERYIASADLVAGYYSDNPKINLTISNKIGEGTYMGKTVISARSPALEEVFAHKEDMIFCDANSAESIANQIKGYYKKKNNPLGKNARKKYDEYLSSTASAKFLLNKIESENLV